MTNTELRPLALKLAGVHNAENDALILATWPDCPTNGDGRAAFIEWMTENDLLQRVQAIDLDAEPESERKNESLAPKLPEAARLTPTAQQEAKLAGRWLDDYVAFASKASPMTPTSFHVGSALFAGSLAIARRLHLPVSVKSNWIRPNLYMLFVGHSTRPRKTTALRVLRGLLESAGMDYFLLPDRCTPEALTRELTLEVPHDFQSWPTERRDKWLLQRPIAAKRGWCLEEASQLLDSFTRDYSKGLLPMVLDLYDASDTGPTKLTVGRGLESIQDAYLSIFGATTYGAMASHAAEKSHWHNGLWARFAIIGDDGGGAWRYWPEPLEYPQDLIDRLRFLAFDLLPMPEAILIEDKIEADDDGTPKTTYHVQVVPDFYSVAVQVEPEAWQHSERYAKAVSWDLIPEQEKKVPGKFYANYGRLSTMLLKVAMILAAFDAECLPVVVEPRHVYRAQQITETWRENLHRILARLSELKFDDDGDLILSVLAGNGSEWMTRRDLLRTAKKRWSDIEPIISDLAESGEIERQEHKPARGPSTEKYRILAGGK